MQKFSFFAVASLIALSTAAQAQSFDINAMPLGNSPTKLDTSETGSIANEKVLVRKIERDGVMVTQYYKIAEDGSQVIVSESGN